MSELAAGVKLNVGTGLCGNRNYTEFLKAATLKPEQGLLLPEDNPVKAVYYNGQEGDLDSGYIYFHFETPIPVKDFNGFFSPEEIIPVI